MTVLLDNKGQGKVGDALAEGIQANAHVSILSSLFSIYGYSSLKKQLEPAGVLRLLIPSNDTSAASAKVQPFRVAGLTGSEADRRFRNSLNMLANSKKTRSSRPELALRILSFGVNSRGFNMMAYSGQLTRSKSTTAVLLPIALALEKRSKPWRLSSTTSCEMTVFWFSAPRKFAKTGRFSPSTISETSSLLIDSILMCSITPISPVNEGVPARLT